ncbi:MAG: sigma-70 family RNA polymerase sigma factor [Polyangiaceae bacterium]
MGDDELVEPFADLPTEVDTPEAVARHLFELSDELTAVDDHDAPAPEPAHPTEPAAPSDGGRVDSLVREAWDQVERVAGAVRREVGFSAEHDELVSVGRTALFEAARSFDPSRANFVPFARLKLRWAMLDHVRREWHGKHYAWRARALMASVRAAEDAPVSAPDPTAPEEHHRRALRSVLAGRAMAMVLGLVGPSLEDGNPDSMREHVERPPHDAPSPEELLLRERKVLELRRAVAALPDRQRTLLERHYFEGEDFDEIAHSFGISKSWASRLHTQALAALAEALRDHR